MRLYEIMRFKKVKDKLLIRTTKKKVTKVTIMRKKRESHERGEQKRLGRLRTWMRNPVLI